MGHKVHPKIYRISRNSDWNSRWYHKNPGYLLEEDFRVREFLNKKLKSVGIERVEIERSSNKLNIIISTSRPGLIIGRGGEGVNLLKKEIEKKILKENDKELRLEIREVKNPWTSAVSSAGWVAQQLERRMPYRRVMKQIIQKVSLNKEVKGVRVEVSGRLNGADIARREWLSSGRLPLQTIRAEIDYARKMARTTYGAIGVKIWIYKGERFD